MEFPEVLAVEGVDIGLYEAIRAISDLAPRSAAETSTVLHASCVDVFGVAVALVGASGAGKSTLAAALAIGGHGFVADEVTAVGRDGVVRPFHRPIGLRGGAAALGVEIPAGPFGYTYPLRMGEVAVLSVGAPLGAVVIVRRNTGPAGVDRMGPGLALVDLANMTLGATGLERVMFQRLNDLVHTVPTYEVRYEELAVGCGFIEDVVRGIGADGD